MKRFYTLQTIILILLSSGICSLAYGQTGVVEGTVLDNTDGLGLPGANVYLKNNLSVGAVTDIDGSFIISGVPVGQQVVIISFLSYATQELTVEVPENGSASLEVRMEAEGITGEEVVVTGQFLGQAKAINQQLSSESLVNIVSADRIQELPDVNAAEAIARLPGIAINRSGGEGQKVVIRGMEPKFAAITVNGVRMPGNSSSDRSVDLSLISPEMLDGIEVFKAPLPDMDGDAVGGTVNLRLSKAPKDLQVLVKGLGGYNALNEDWGDHKGVLQISKRILDNKLGIVAQGSLERFNRGGDFLTNNWRRGATNDSTGITEILGNSLQLEDQREIRRRYNGSLALDYDLGKHRFGFFGLYSRTTRNRFTMEENYEPNEPAITFVGRDIENNLNLTSLSLQGEHPLGRLLIDWTLATSASEGKTPYDFTMRFVNNSQVFDSALDKNSHPRNYYAAASVDLAETLLWNADVDVTSTSEQTHIGALNLKYPFSINSKIGGYFKIGGKYTSTQRDRQVSRRAEDFYYLGGQIARDAIEAYPDDLILLPNNPELISILSFAEAVNEIGFVNESDENIGLKASLDPELMRQWHDAQQGLFSNDRAVILDNYEVEESVGAGYAMFRLDFGKRLTVIPGLRYEYSDNTYRSGISSINGRYGVNGFFNDTTTFQQYGVLLPHLHLKVQATDWLDVRASYTNTLSRPDFTYVTPRIQIDNNQTIINAGNPELSYATATNYDLFVSAFNGKFGLLSVGVFYKEVDNIFYPWRTNLFDQETADAFGFSNYKGYELRTYINSEPSTIKGFEIDLQTNFRWLPNPFKGLVLNVNYARLASRTEVFFLTSETILINPVPPVFETIYTNNVREVAMPSQAPHVFNMSVGYDLKGFSARISGAYQGTKAVTYSSNKDFDRFNLHFWRWDASVRQNFKENWSVFLNLNNFTNQQDITFIRTEQYINTIETYGLTATVGLQYRIR
ncbi:MAG: TonB-dependent receptor [Phaeodactylibacter sp.]|nr:TonB-dependent receptor [Phaeodactylibacter sp.]